MSETGAQRIAAAFAAAPGRAALMPYLMGGFPDVEISVEVGLAYADNGADLVELGVPFSDPLADAVPVVLMCYANLVFARGAERFADDLAARGIAGLIVPDLPLEEAAEIRDACEAAGVALVPLVAPTTPEERLAAIGASARGFLYTVSVTGTTGERTALSDAFAGVVARAKAHTRVPVALGFGIATPEHAAQAADAGADGVIVGSRLVRAAGEAADPATAVREVVAAMADALAV